MGQRAKAILGPDLIQPGHDEQAGREFVEAKLLTDKAAAQLASLGNAVVVYAHIQPEH